MLKPYSYFLILFFFVSVSVALSITLNEDSSNVKCIASNPSTPRFQEDPVRTFYNVTPSSRILLFPCITFSSHLRLFQILAEGLYEAGHRPTLLLSDRRTLDTPHPHYNVERFPGLFSSKDAEEFNQNLLTELLAGSNPVFLLFKIILRYCENCSLIFTKGRSLLDRLRQSSYDLVIVDPNELCGLLVARELNVPHIIFSTGMWIPAYASPASPASALPEFNSLLSDRMSFASRLYNTASYIAYNIVLNAFLYPLYDSFIFKHHIGWTNTLLPQRTKFLLKSTPLWLLSTDTALEFPGPRWSHTEYVGGIMARPPNPLPPEFGDFADDAAAYGGLVLVAFGGDNRKLTPSLEAIFIRVLSNLPYRVLWRYTSNAVPLVGPNVKIVEWFPQNDLLAHRNTLVFVSHGGTNGVYESLYHAVPIVGIPLFGDQYDSMVRIEAKGMGIMLDWKALSDTHLHDAICNVISQKKYREAITYYSNVFKDETQPPLQRAITRINYVLRYKGAPHLRPAILDMHWYQVFYVDIILAVIFTLFCVFSSFKFIHSQWTSK